MKKISIIIIILISTAFLFAEKKVKSDSTAYRKYYRLDAIRVIAKDTDESIGTIKTKELNKEEISGDINFYETLKGEPGIALTSGSKGESNLRIRTFQKEDVKIMIDGRTLNGGYFGNVNLLELPLFDVEEVQMLKGPVSSLYGVNSMGGTVNYISKKPNHDDWLKLSTVFKRNSTNNSKLMLSHAFEEWDFWLNLSSNTTDGFVLSKDFKPTVYENGDIRNLTNNQVLDAQAKLNFTLLDYQSVGFTAGYTYADEKNIPNSIYESRYRKFSDWKRYNSSLLLSFIHAENVESEHRVFFDAFDNTYHEYSDADMNNETLKSLLESYSLTYEGKINMRLDSQNHSSVLYKLEKQYYNRIDNRTYLTEVDNATYTNVLSFFNIYRLKENIELSAGSGLSNSIRDISSKKIETPVYLDYCAGVSWNNTFVDRINLGFSKNIQYPTMHELFSESRGNLYLDAEKAYKTELSVTHYIKNDLIPMSLSQTIFFNSIYDMIERKGDRYQNLLHLKNAGSESSLSLLITKKVSAEVNYTYINLDMNNTYDFYEIPQKQFGFKLYADLFSFAKLAYQFDYFDTRLSPDDNDIIHTLDAYSLHTLTLTKSYKKTKLIMAVENILDEDYQEEYGFPASGINFTLGVEVVLF